MLQQPVEAEATTEDFDDLDDLLEESTKLAKAKKQKATGRKLDSELEELLESSRDAEEHRLWEVTSVLAHFKETTCDCGCVTTRFDGWFQLSTHKRLADVHKLLRVEEFGELPAEQWTTTEEVAYCLECLSELDLPVAEPLEIFEGLGEMCCEEEGEISPQLELFDFETTDNENGEEEASLPEEACDEEL